MAPTTATTPTAAQAGPKLKPKPKRQQTFLELYNSSSTGHQVSNGVSKPTAWHKSRQSKLNQQFRNSTLPLSFLASNPPSRSDTPQNTSVPSSSSSSAATTISTPPPAKTAKPIFSSCSIYISGTTAPLISDHTLKHLLVHHGAHVSTLLRRSTTTHVILTTAGKVGSGAGGGLAAGKLQKEIDSRKAGKKLSEAKYTDVAVGRSAGQGTLMAFVGKENVGK
ncbi:hypothetical protein K440DRAFT_639886 [Wilcoxina mikolae CBS 423.85]|nr:hypothetical protein K440DRAFT_639886 [Wilcoxina mikolae CBS 423.85]